MKTIQQIAGETRELLSNLRSGNVRIDKADCSKTLWDLRGYLADDDERNRLDTILANIEFAAQEIEDIDEYFEPTQENDVNELWGWLICNQSHVRLVEQAIQEYSINNPAKTHDLYKSIGRALLEKELEIFGAAKAYIMEEYKNQPDDEDEDEEDCDDEE
jgi:uncharacterized protein YydD (DUF2326 family)